MPPKQEYYIVMDNIGGHGTNDHILIYLRNLKEKDNVVIIFQIPRSLYTNVIDLRVWMRLQAAVERHRILQ